MRITGCELHAVACFDHLTLEFPEGSDPALADTYIFAGPNGTGKSTLLAAFAQLFGVMPLGFERRLRGPESYAAIRFAPDGELLLRSDAATERLPDALSTRGEVLARPLGGYTGYTIWALGSSSAAEQLAAYRSKAFAFRPESPTPLDFAAFAYSGQRVVGRYQLRAIEESSDSPLAEALDPEKRRSTTELVQWLANTKAKEAFAFRRGDDARVAAYAASVARIEGAVSSVIGEPFRFRLDEEPLRVLADYAGAAVELDLLPDGLKAILAWAGDILVRLERIPWVDERPVVDRPILLLLDELDVHLHPLWQRRVLPTLQRLFPQAQVFLSTHSPFVLASARDAWLYPLEQTARGVVCEHPVRAEVGSSHSRILRELMGVEGEFADDVMAEFVSFYALRDRALAGDGAALGELHAVGARLRSYGVETAAIVGRELARASRALESGAAR